MIEFNNIIKIILDNTINIRTKLSIIINYLLKNEIIIINISVFSQTNKATRQKYLIGPR